MTTRKTVLLGVDQGTTNTKALVVDENAQVLGETSRSIATHSPMPGVVEQDAEAMFYNLVACAKEALAKTGRTAADVIALGISNQTETLVVWDKSTTRPVMPAMVWQCRRGQNEIVHLRQPDSLSAIRRKTGIELDPTFTAAKLKWVTTNHPDIAAGLRAGKLLWGTVDIWLRWKLSGGKSYATEPGNAARTMLFDIDRLAWDKDLAGLFALDLPAMPELRPSVEPRDLTAPGLFGCEIPIAASLGDQQASLFGHGCFAAGDTKITYGTGAFAWMNKGTTSNATVPDGLIRTIAWAMGETTYAFEGFVMYAGATLDWIASRLDIKDGGAGVARAAEQAGNSAGVILVPAFQGLAGPWWQPEAKAMLTGLTAATERGHIAHAALESIAWQIRILLEGMGTHGSISVDGGVTRSDYFLQIQANAVNTPLARASVEAASPFGAALAAGIGAGHWSKPDDLRPLICHDAPVLPQAADTLKSFDTWRRWVEATIAASHNLYQ